MAFAAKSSLTPRNDTYPFIDPNRFKGKLSGRTVLITGASSGIGRISAFAFARAGAKVACVARRRNSLEAVVDEIQKYYAVKAVAVAGDISDPKSAKPIVKNVEELLGPIDILVNNAGVTRYNSFEAEADIGDWWRVMEINLLGTISMVQAVLPSMLARRTGTIISLASTSGSQDVPFQTAYATSKAGIIKFHQDLDVEIRDRGIKTFSVHPGSVMTELSKTPGAINMETVQKTPQMMEIFSQFQDHEYQTPHLAANTMVALCADPNLKVLSGKYIDSQHDLGEVLQDAGKGDQSDITRKNLYRLKLEAL